MKIRDGMTLLEKVLFQEIELSGFSRAIDA
jgi:hypothetical protein